MFSYQLSPDLLENITLIERLYGQLEASHLPTKLQLNLERNNLIESTYVSNSIEGNPLTLPEVTNLLLDGRVPANRSEAEIKNYFELLKKLPDLANRPLTAETILDLHRQLMTGTDDDIAGNFRDHRVVIGHRFVQNDEVKIHVKHEPPFHHQAEIEQAMTDLLTWWRENDALPIIKIGLFHHRYVYIHPFVDGNGRTVRLLTALLFLQVKYQINKYFVLDDYYDLDREAYSDALHSADGGDSTAWLEYFTDGLKYSLQSALAKTQNALKTLAIEDRPSPREQEVLAEFKSQPELTSGDIAEKFNVSRQQAQNLLAALVDKGLVTKKGETKSAYYVLST